MGRWVTEGQILMTTLIATVTQAERLQISTNTWHNNIPFGIYSMVTQFLGLRHVIKPNEGVALGFSTWQQPPSFHRQESGFMSPTGSSQGKLLPTGVLMQLLEACRFQQACGQTITSNEAWISKSRLNSTPTRSLPIDLDQQKGLSVRQDENS